MAFENLIIREKRKIGGITIDGVISETTVRTMRMTSNPVETGDNIADHVIQEPLTYSMEGVITDTPLGFGDLFGSTTGVPDNVSGVFGKSDSSGQTRSQQVYYAIVDLMNKKELLTVETSLKRYEDLILETVSVQQDKDKARAIFFNATFKQALLVVSASEDVDQSNIVSDSDKAGLAKTTDNGIAATRNTTISETSLATSSLSQ